MLLSEMLYRDEAGWPDESDARSSLHIVFSRRGVVSGNPSETEEDETILVGKVYAIEGVDD